MSKIKLSVDAELVVRDSRAGRTETFMALVARVGRDYVYLKSADHRRLPTERFSLEDRTGSGSRARFYTPQEWEEHQRTTRATDFLRSRGIWTKHESPYRHDTITLANLIRAHEGLDAI